MLAKIFLNKSKKIDMVTYSEKMQCSVQLVGFSIRCQVHVVTVDHQQRDQKSLFRAHSPQREITSTTQRESK